MTHQPRARRRAIRRGMRFIAALAHYDGSLAYLSSGLLYFCGSLARTAHDRQLAAEAAALGRLGFRHWKAQFAQFARPAGRGAPGAADFDAGTVTEFVRAYGAAESFGVRAPRVKAALRRAAGAFGADELLGFDPRREPPPADVPQDCGGCGLASPRGRRRCADPSCRAPLARSSRYRTWCLALTSAYCGERYGVRLGARYRDAFRWLPMMRPYRLRPGRGSDGTGRVPSPDFYDAVYAVTHVVYTLNDYGRFLLAPEWLPWEYAFLRTHIDTAVAANDPDMAGEFLDTLRAFGVDDADGQVRRTYDFLLESQNPDGSWGEWDAESLYAAFHATWAAIDGLREYSWTGPGILFPELLPSLRRWSRIRY